MIPVQLDIILHPQGHLFALFVHQLMLTVYNVHQIPYAHYVQLAGEETFALPVKWDTQVLTVIFAQWAIIHLLLDRSIVPFARQLTLIAFNAHQIPHVPSVLWVGLETFALAVRSVTQVLIVIVVQ